MRRGIHAASSFLRPFGDCNMGKVQLRNLGKTFGKVEVIKNANLEIENGEFVVFVGPSGCGKSTMLRMIAGLESVSNGEVLIDDAVVNNLPPVERGISMVFQSYALYPHLSVYENIAFPLRVAKMSNDEIDKRVMQASKILKLDERIQNKPGELSGGQRQRVAIGRSIVREPKVFLFDEPLSNLDAALRADMRVELSSLHKELGNTMIYVTHDQVEAMTMADKIVVLNKGDISQVGSPLELYYQPANKFVAGFIGNPNMNFLNATYVGEDSGKVLLNFQGQEIALPVTPRDISHGAPVSIGVRPDEMISSKDNSVELEIVPQVVEYLGSTTVIYAEHPLAEDRIRIVQPGTMIVKEGAPIQVGFQPQNCYLFDEKGHAFRRHLEGGIAGELPSYFQ